MNNEQWRALFGLIIEKPFPGWENWKGGDNFNAPFSSEARLKAQRGGFIVAPGFYPGNKELPTFPKDL